MANLRPRFLQPMLASALLISATPTLALQTIDARDGVSVEASIALKEATRIKVDGATAGVGLLAERHEDETEGFGHSDLLIDLLSDAADHGIFKKQGDFLEAEPGISLSSPGRVVIRIGLADRFENFSCDIGLHRA